MSIGGGAALGTAYGEVLIGVTRSLSNLGQLNNALQTTGRVSASSSQGMTEWGFALAGAGAAAVGAIGLAINKAASFQKQMSAVGAAIGSEAIPAMDELRDTALRIGKDTKFSANEAALAMEELAKAGVSAGDIMGGVADATVDLAAAVDTDLSTAAGLVTVSLAQFGLGAKDAASAVDTITAAINESRAEVPDFLGGLRNIGPVVANMGGNLEDASAAIATFVNYGLKGADVGVSLARGLTMAASPTDKAAAKMEELGIAVFDAQGKFVGFPELFDNLNKSLGDASDQTREEALSLIFGAEAADVMGIAVREGGDAFRFMRDQMDPAGQAAESAATRMDNLSGDMEQLSGSVETAEIVIGDLFIPTLRRLAQFATGAVNAFLSLPAPLQKVAAIGTLAAGSMAALAGSYLLLGTRIQAMIRVLPRLIALLAAVSAPVAAVVAVLAALGAAYRFNLFGFRDAVTGIAEDIRKGFDIITKAAGPVKAVIGALFGTSFQSGGKFTTQVQSINAAVTALGKTFGLSQEQQRQVRTALVQTAKPLRQLRNSYRDVTRGAQLFFDMVTTPGSWKEYSELSKRFNRLFGRDIGRQAIRATQRLQRGVGGLGKALRKEFGFDFGKLFTLPGILEVGQKAVTGFATFVRRDLIPALGPPFVAAVNGAAAVLEFLAENMDTIGTVVRTLASLVGETLAAPFRVLAALLRGDFAGALGVVTDLIGSFLSAGHDLLDWVLTVGPPRVKVWASDLWDWIVSAGAPAFFAFVGTVTNWIMDVGAPAVIGWLSDTAGKAWDALQDVSGWALDKGSIAAGWLLDVGVPTAAGWLARVAGNVAGWLRGVLIGGQPVGDGSDQGAASEGILVNLPGILIDGIASLGDVLGKIAGNVGTWAAPLLRAGWDGLIDLGGVFVDALPSIPSFGNLWELVGNASTWFAGRIREGWDGLIDLGSLFLDALPSFLTGGNLSRLVGTIGSWIAEQLKRGWTGLVDLGSAAIDAIPTIGGFGTDLAAWVGESLGPKIATALRFGWTGIVNLGGILIDAAVDLAGVLKTIRDEFPTWLPQAINWVEDKTVQVGKLIIKTDTTIQDASGDDDKPGRTFVEKVVAGIERSVDALHRAGLFIVGNLFFGIGLAFGTLVAGFAGIILLIGNGIIKAAQDPASLLSAGSTIVDGIIAAVNKSFDLSGELFDVTAGKFWDGISTAFEHFVPELTVPNWIVNLDVPDIKGEWFVIGPDNPIIRKVVQVLKDILFAPIKFGDYLIDLQTPKSVTAAFNLISTITDALGFKTVGGHTLSIPVPTWDLNLPKPNISFGGLLGHGFDAATEIVRWIGEEIVGLVPSVSLPDWDLTFPNAPDMSALSLTTVTDWIKEKVTGLGTPSFPLGIGFDIDALADHITAASGMLDTVSQAVASALGWAWEKGAFVWNISVGAIIDVFSSGGETDTGDTKQPETAAGAEALAAALEAAQLRINTAAAAIGTDLQTLSTTLGTVRDDMKVKGQAIMANVSAGFALADPSPKTKAVELMQGAQTVIHGYIDVFRQDGIDLIGPAGLVGGMGEASPGPVVKTLELMRGANQTVTDFQDDFLTGGKTLIVKASEGMGQASDTLVETTRHIVNAAWNAVNNLASLFKTAGQGLGGNLVTGINDKASDIASAAGDAVQGAVNAASDATSGAYSVGYSIGQGINNGIAFWTSAIAATAVAAVNGAESQARSAVDGNSPSRLFMALGSDIGEGLFLGIKGWLSPFADVTQQFVSQGADLFTALTGMGDKFADASVSNQTAVTLAPSPQGADGTAGITNIYQLGTLTIQEAEDLIRWGKFVDDLGPTSETSLGLVGSQG